MKVVFALLQLKLAEQAGNGFIQICSEFGKKCRCGKNPKGYAETPEILPPLMQLLFDKKSMLQFNSY